MAKGFIKGVKSELKKVVWPTKKQLINNIIEYLKPIKEKRAYYEQHPEIVDRIILDGTKKAQKEAKETMKKIKQAMKLDYFKEEME